MTFNLFTLVSYAILSLQWTPQLNSGHNAGITFTYKFLWAFKLRVNIKEKNDIKYDDDFSQ